MSKISTILFFTLFSICLLADNYSGQCGDSLYWKYDNVSSHLDITGKGDMNLTKYPAWTSYRLKIASVTFSDSLTSIDHYAFEGQDLVSVVVPASVTKFGKQVFRDNLSLLRFEYQGDHCTGRSEQILYNCKNLRYFKGAVRMLYYCDALDTVIVTHDYAYTNFAEVSYVDNSKAYDIRLYGKYSETPKKIKKLILPDSLLDIGYYLLCNAFDLEGITIPSKVQKIDKSAFLNCYSLDSLVFTSDALNEICDSAFANCTALAYISLPDTIPPTICEHTFDGVSRSIPIYIPYGTTQQYQEAPYWSEFTCFVESPISTTIEHPYAPTEENFSTQKLLYNNQLLILHRGILYSITGQPILMNF